MAASASFATSSAFLKTISRKYSLEKKLNFNGKFCVKAETKEAEEATLTGVIFQPFEEVQSQLTAVPATTDVSYARQRYSAASEAAINEQIK